MLDAVEREAAAKERAMKLVEAVRGSNVKAVEALPAESTISKDATPLKAAAGRAKELAVGAVKQALTKVDASVEEKIERAKKLVRRPRSLERE